MGGMLVAGTYKKYGQTAFKSDKFLTLVGSLSSICNASGRVGWGLLSDKIGPMRALVMMSAGLALLLGTYSLSLASQFSFAVHTMLIFTFFAGNFALW
jgi:nitrate/nitrite transporter NarK